MVWTLELNVCLNLYFVHVTYIKRARPPGPKACLFFTPIISIIQAVFCVKKFKTYFFNLLVKTEADFQIIFLA